MKLFLSSSGITDSNQKQFLDLLGKDPHGLHVAFINTAAKGDHLSTPRPLLTLGIKRMSDYQDLKRLGFEITILYLEDYTEETIRDALAPFDVIYVYGGNTFYLLHHVNHSGFRKYVREIIAEKVYVGVSAGSLIMGPDIALAGWPPTGDQNKVGITHTAGLSLIPFCILPHWDGEMPKEAGAYPFEVRYIKDGEAIVITK